MLRRAFLLVLMLPLAPVYAAIDMDTAAHIYEAAAVREQVRSSLGGMPARMREMFAADAKTTLTEPQLAAIGAAATHGFRIDVFEPPALAALAQSLDAPAAKKIQAFLGSDLGLRMVAADRAVSALDEPTIDKIMTGQLLAPSTPKRDALTEKLSRASRSTESTVQIFMSMGRAVAMGAAIGTGADPQAIDEHSRKNAADSHKEMEANMREPLRRYLAYGYRDLSDSDLKHLLSFLESKPGVLYVDAYTNALDAGFDAMGKRCGEQLGESLRELAQADAQAQALEKAQLPGNP
jgi:hypothetical protein